MAEEKRCNKRLWSVSVKNFITDFPDLMFDGSHVVCLVCNKKLLCWKRQMYTRHINSTAHKDKKNGQRLYTVFLFDLIFMMSACNIPFKTVYKQAFRHFWEKNASHCKFPKETTLKRYLPYVRKRIENNIIAQINNKKVWLTIDETTDSRKNSVVNIIIRTMNPFQPSFPYLIASKRLHECTGNGIKALVLKTLQKFGISTKQVLMFVTNDGPNMVHAGSLLKNACPNLVHVTCLLNTLHLVAETIRHSYPDVDALIAHTNAVFHKSPKRIRQFNAECPGIKEPPEPVLTRWGTWLEAALYYCQHFQKIKSLVLKFDSKEAASIELSQSKFKNAHVEVDLITIYNNYLAIADAIQKLQNLSLSLTESLQILDNVQIVLNSLNDEKSSFVKGKFNSVMLQNVGLAKVRQIYTDRISLDPLSHYRDYFTYAQVTSLDVEKSFSLHKNIFSPMGTSLKETTVETYGMFQMFSQAHPDF